MRALLSRWVLTFIGTALLAALVWVFGPLLPELEPTLARVTAIQSMFVAWGALNGWLTWRRRAREAALTAGVTADPHATQEEAAAVGAKLRDALKLLKQSGQRGYLFEKPWYAIIGPPGAGKTTALLNAGLRFPLAEAGGGASLAGVGGTRLCEWWFTEDAVLIDTAGRYTTQDSDAAVDRAGWDAFLALLKRTRPRQPLNGVLVAIALPTLVQAHPVEQQAHAAAIRSRIAELERTFGLRLPVYALFTKADLIAGFSEYFDDLDREGRDQVWGTTFKLDAAADAFPTGFRTLLARLNGRLSGRLQAERRPDRRGPIAGFPSQVASLEKPLAAFLQAAFAPNSGRAAPMLRGVYFTSGTQEGTPIDRLTGAMSRAFGIDQRRAAALRPEQGRSYFLGRLLREVVLGEAMLVREAPGAARRYMLMRVAGFAAVLLAVLGAAGWLWADSAAAMRQLDAGSAAVASYEQAAAAVALDPVEDGDLRPLVPLLDGSHALADQLGPPVGGVLAQDAKLAAGARGAYRDALVNGLLPRLLWRLEAAMRGALNRPDQLYEITKVYLMLGSAGPLDRTQLRDWMVHDWESSYPAPEDEPLRAALARHLDAALAEPLPPLELDGALVTRAREAFARVPLADRVYASIRSSAAAQALAPWRPVDALGAAGAQVFQRASGKPMADGIPGFLTSAGFQSVLLPSLAAATRAVASESWVVGSRTDPTPAELQSLQAEVTRRYLADFTQAWDAMLADLTIEPMRTMLQGAQDLYVLSSPDSPMRVLLAALGQQLQPALAGGRELEQRYKPLIDLVPAVGAAPVDQILRLIAEVQQPLAKLAALPVGTPIPTGGEDIATALQAEAGRQPQPLSRWLQAMASSATSLRTGGVRRQAITAFSANGGPSQVCQASANGRYPFAPPSTTANVSVDDFARLFAPGGLIDGFFNTQLKGYVDTSSKPWKPKADASAPPVTGADILQFQRAAGIRDAFFGGGKARPAVQFELQPVSMDPGAAKVTLDLGGTSIAYAKGATAQGTEVSWPPPDPSQPARLVFDPPAAELSDTGPWSMFRLFARGKLQPGAKPGRFTLTFQSGERQAVFELRSGAAVNPFTPGLLADFKCPAVQQVAQ